MILMSRRMVVSGVGGGGTGEGARGWRLRCGGRVGTECEASGPEPEPAALVGFSSTAPAASSGGAPSPSPSSSESLSVSLPLSCSASSAGKGSGVLDAERDDGGRESEPMGVRSVCDPALTLLRPASTMSTSLVSIPVSYVAGRNVFVNLVI
jgi:hypothetical protein